MEPHQKKNIENQIIQSNMGLRIRRGCFTKGHADLNCYFTAKNTALVWPGYSTGQSPVIFASSLVNVSDCETDVRYPSVRMDILKQKEFTRVT